MLLFNPNTTGWLKSSIFRLKPCTSAFVQWCGTYQYFSRNFSSIPLFICTDIDECLNNPCGNNSICINSIGSYTCHCDLGFYETVEKTCAGEISKYSPKKLIQRSVPTGNRQRSVPFSNVSAQTPYALRGWATPVWLSGCPCRLLTYVTHLQNITLYMVID